MRPYSDNWCLQRCYGFLRVVVVIKPCAPASSIVSWAVVGEQGGCWPATIEGFS